ncbi:MAG: sensor histidine kinase [Candidatus Riflebacteria bacterium]|nr:sensor histidine kinase [Candidatus Riflebacteria bacterium]
MPEGTRPALELSRKLVWYSVVMALLGLVLTLGLSYVLLMRYHETELKSDLVTAARATTRTVESCLYAGLLQATSIGQLGKVQQTLHAVRIPHDRGAGRDPRSTGSTAGTAVDARSLDLSSFLGPRIWHISIFDRGGREVATTSQVPDPEGRGADWWQTTLARGAWIGEPRNVAGEEVPLLPVAVVVECPETGGADGVVRVEVNWQNVIDALAPAPIGFDTGHSFVADSLGRFIAHRSRSRLMTPLEGGGATELMEAVKRHATGALATRIRNPRSGLEEQLFVGFAHITGDYEYDTPLSWWVGVAARESNVRRDVYAAMLLGATGTTLVACLVILGVQIGTRRLLAPLAEIKLSLDRFGSGQLGERMEVRTGDELETLAGTFNKMADGLKESRLELESKVHELFTANQSLRELARVKAQLVANVSHEVRTPLHSIIGFTEVTIAKLRGRVPELQMANLDRVRKNAYHLLDMINQILDFSKLDSGQARVTVTEVNVADEVATVLQLISPLVGPDVELNEETIDRVTIRTDRQKLQQILMNLLSNAVKFTQNGTIVVVTRKEADRVTVDVKDTGVGVPEEYLTVIFDEFRQVDGSAVRKYGGTGLGLAIVKSLIKLLEGEIEVTSKVGVGSTFRVTLPLDLAPAGGGPPDGWSPAI